MTTLLSGIAIRSEDLSDRIVKTLAKHELSNDNILPWRSSASFCAHNVRLAEVLLELPTIIANAVVWTIGTNGGAAGRDAVEVALNTVLDRIFPLAKNGVWSDDLVKAPFRYRELLREHNLLPGDDLTCAISALTGGRNTDISEIRDRIHCGAMSTYSARAIQAITRMIEDRKIVPNQELINSVDWLAMNRADQLEGMLSSLHAEASLEELFCLEVENLVINAREGKVPDSLTWVQRINIVKNWSELRDLPPSVVLLLTGGPLLEAPETAPDYVKVVVEIVYDKLNESPTLPERA